MRADLAITRGVSPALADCQLTYLSREPIDVLRAVAQHQQYVHLLQDLGLRVEQLPADPALPDCCFVEDTAVVLDEVAVVTRPGAPSRRGETEAVAQALERHRPVVRLAAPARIDGGDVLVLGRRIHAGRTQRTDEAGIAALAAAVAPFGYVVVPTDVSGCLHLKSAVTELADGLLLMNPAWVDPHQFPGFEVVGVAGGEPWAANVLRVGEVVVAAHSFPRTLEAIAARGIDVRAVDVSEFLKAEAGLTCKSLLLSRRPASA